jgi:hypothetical protein
MEAWAGSAVSRSNFVMPAICARTRRRCADRACICRASSIVATRWALLRRRPRPVAPASTAVPPRVARPNNAACASLWPPTAHRRVRLARARRPRPTAARMPQARMPRRTRRAQRRAPTLSPKQPRIPATTQRATSLGREERGRSPRAPPHPRFEDTPSFDVTSSDAFPRIDRSPAQSRRHESPRHPLVRGPA